MNTSTQTQASKPTTHIGSSTKNQTRDALIKAAIEIFGRDGFAAASTRAIADSAGVNQALINYHFKTKQGLYLAVFEYINAFLEQGMGSALTKVETNLIAITTPTEDFYWSAIKELLGGMLRMINSTETKEWSSLITREQQHPTEAFAILNKGVHGRLRQVLSVLVARQLKLSEGSEAAKLITFTLMGQILIFKVARATVLSSMDWEKITENKLQKIEHIIFQNFAKILNVEDENKT